MTTTTERPPVAETAGGHAAPRAARSGEGATARGRCQIEGCDKPSQARGRCHHHYRRWQEQQPDRPRCADCTRGAITKGRCDNHARLQRRRLNSEHAREWERANQRHRRGISHDVYRCSDCGGSFAAKADGALFAHRRAGGTVCSGSDRFGSHVVQVAS